MVDRCQLCGGLQTEAAILLGQLTLRPRLCLLDRTPLERTRDCCPEKLINAPKHANALLGWVHAGDMSDFLPDRADQRLQHMPLGNMRGGSGTRDLSQQTDYVLHSPLDHLQPRTHDGLRSQRAANIKHCQPASEDHHSIRRRVDRDSQSVVAWGLERNRTCR